MAAKMRAARNSSGNPISVDEAEFLPKQDFQCVGCTTTVIYNAGSQPERHGRIVNIPHYFRLKRNYSHDANCKFNVFDKIKVIADNSDKNFIKQFKDGVYELRLLLPSDGSRKNGTSGGSSDDDDGEDEGKGSTRVYVSSGKLNSYLNTASAVLKLRGFCDEHSEIENHLVLKFGTTKVFWNDFYFEIDEYKHLYHILQASTDAYPVAVSGNINQIKELPLKSDSKKNFWIVNLDVPFEKPDADGVVKKMQVSVSTFDKRFLDGLAVDDDVVIFGKWLSESVNVQPNLKKDSNIKVYENLPLKFRLTNKRQIIKI